MSAAVYAFFKSTDKSGGGCGGNFSFFAWDGMALPGFTNQRLTPVVCERCCQTTAGPSSAGSFLCAKKKFANRALEI